MPVHVGVARRDISPTKPMFLVGYPHESRTSTGVHDPLFASALHLSDGYTQVITIAVDLLFVGREDVARWRMEIQKRTGVPASNILISATHTHSGPLTVDYLVFRGDPIVPPIDPHYMRHLDRGVVEAAAAAKASSGPAKVAVTSARVDGVGTNRLDPAGPRDADVAALVARRPDSGTPFAVHVVYAMHPTVLHEDTTKVTSDFPGYTRVHIEDNFPGAVTCYHNGISGNLSPRYHVKGQTFAEAERLGRALGQAVVDAVRKLQPSDYRDDLTLAAGQRIVPLQRRTFQSLDHARANLTQKRAEYERLKREGAPRPQVRTAECTLFGAEEVLTLAQTEASGEVESFARRYAQVEVQALRIGDTFYAAFPGELFTEYALELKQKAPARTFAISLANGETQGYIVTPEAEAANGYEAQMSFFPSSAGGKLIDAMLDLMRSLG